MTLNEYQQKCVDALPKYLYRGDEALIGLMGLSSSAGKSIELYKKTLYEGKELDNKALAELLGDAVHCVAVIAHAIDYNLADVLKLDMEKNPDAGNEKV